MGQSNNKEKYEYSFGYQIIKSPNGIFEKLSPYDYTFDHELPNELVGVVSEEEYINIGKYIHSLAGYGSPHLQYIMYLPLVFLMIFLDILSIVNISPAKSSDIFMIASVIVFLIIIPHAIITLYRSGKLRKRYVDPLKPRGIEVNIVPKVRAYLIAFILIYFVHFIIANVAKFYYYYSNFSELDMKLVVICLLFVDSIILLFLIFNIILFSRFRYLLTCTSYYNQYENQFTQVLNDNIEKYLRPVPLALFYDQPIQLQPQQTQQPQQIQFAIDIKANSNSSSSSTILPLYSNIDIDAEQSQKLLDNQNNV